MKKIKLKGIWATREVWLNGKKLNPSKSQKLVNHSPDGFNWGYGGSGPAQLALAICIELYGMPKMNPLRFDYDYLQFKWDFIATLPQSDFDIELAVPTNDIEVDDDNGIDKQKWLLNAVTKYVNNQTDKKLNNILVPFRLRNEDGIVSYSHGDVIKIIKVIARQFYNNGKYNGEKYSI